MVKRRKSRYLSQILKPIPARNSLLSKIEEQAIKIKLLEAEKLELIKKQSQILQDKIEHEKKIDCLLRTSFKHLAALINIQGFFNSGFLMPEVAIPAMWTWPISADVAYWLVGRLVEQPYDAVIEFGSGHSTLIMANALQMIREQRPESKDTKHVAFEHLQEFHQKTENLLINAGLVKPVDLQYSPLVNYQESDGEKYLYYHCLPTLKALAEKLPDEAARILVLVDGPPAATGNKARYPALSHLLRAFPCGNLDILCDDYCRDDEKKMIKEWESRLKTLNYQFNRRELNFEKGGLLFSVYKQK